MKKPVSIFMMDVTNSSRNWNDITNYLEALEGYIKVWTRGLPNAHVKHRLGDEIVCIFDHFSTAYTVAFYLNQLWRLEDQPPYFGMSFGLVEEDLAKIDIDKWNHPLMRQARLANEKIKASTNRTSILLFPDSEVISIQSLDMLNLLLEYQGKLINEQTKLQRLISGLYSVLEEQKTIADLLRKSPSTISSHYKKGNCEILFKTLHTIQQTLNHLEETYADTYPKNLTMELNKTIKNQLKQNLDILLLK
ncbi:hypothetical protein [Sutcliffiella halmapala]|uniref:hypothetical protein n=1 Tax=Sutcliffiella halmapala TaxID=79882 RepID=UPI000995AAB1|nr:hypothetical protein [Sutcliffiella halmapala]